MQYVISMSFMTISLYTMRLKKRTTFWDRSRTPSPDSPNSPSGAPILKNCWRSGFLNTGSLVKLKFDPSKVQIIIPQSDLEQKGDTGQAAPPPDFGAPKADDKGKPAAAPAGKNGSSDNLEDLFKK